MIEKLIQEDKAATGYLTALLRHNNQNMRSRIQYHTPLADTIEKLTEIIKNDAITDEEKHVAEALLKTYTALQSDFLTIKQ